MLDIQRQKPKKPAQLHMFVASFFSFHLFVVQMFLCLKNLYKLYYILYFIVTLLMFALVLNSFKKNKNKPKNIYRYLSDVLPLLKLVYIRYHKFINVYWIWHDQKKFRKWICEWQSVILICKTSHVVIWKLGFLRNISLKSTTNKRNIATFYFLNFSSFKVTFNN